LRGGGHLAHSRQTRPGADNTYNVPALAFGVRIVMLMIGGSLWIMANLNHDMMPMDQIRRCSAEAE
jgi:cytochrome o ubiquinol oxidase subunit IV